ncbi:retrovirus-related pol polyprotein from transposon TNT 1-94 [Tanacetum coccineum]
MYHKKAQSDPATRLIPDSEEIAALAVEVDRLLNKDLSNHWTTTKIQFVQVFHRPTSLASLYNSSSSFVDSGCTQAYDGQMYTAGNDLLTGNRGSDLYTISLQDTTSSTPICLMAKASPTQAWLWHRRLSHLNFDYINLLSKKDIVIGLPKLKYVKDQLCSSCEVSKAKRSSFKSKTVPSSKGRLNLLHMDLMWSMRLLSIMGKIYSVIVDDYSRYTLDTLSTSKDETPKF